MQKTIGCFRKAIRAVKKSNSILFVNITSYWIWRNKIQPFHNMTNNLAAIYCVYSSCCSIFYIVLWYGQIMFTNPIFLIRRPLSLRKTSNWNCPRTFILAYWLIVTGTIHINSRKKHEKPKPHNKVVCRLCRNKFVMILSSSIKIARTVWKVTRRFFISRYWNSHNWDMKVKRKTLMNYAEGCI